MRTLQQLVAVAAACGPALASAAGPVAPPARGSHEQALAQSTTYDPATSVHTDRGLQVNNDLRPDIGEGSSVRISERFSGPGGTGFRDAFCRVPPGVYRAAAGSATLDAVIDTDTCEQQGWRSAPVDGPWRFEGTIVVSARWGRPLDVEQGTSVAQRTTRGAAPGGYRERCEYFNGQAAIGHARIGDATFALSWEWGDMLNNQYSYFQYRHCVFTDL